MKKAIIAVMGIFLFSCGGDNTTNDAAQGTEIDESVEVGAGEEVSPQLNMEDDTGAFEVDTISTPQQSNQ